MDLVVTSRRSEAGATSRSLVAAYFPETKPAPEGFRKQTAEHLKYDHDNHNGDKDRRAAVSPPL
jgi:hypothetical protein